MSTAPFVSLVDRIPPSNLEAEMAVLGSVLVDKEMMAAVSEIVRPNDFYASLHETIYLALYALYESGKPLDKVALAEELRSRGMLDKIGGLAYLSSLMDTVPTAASAEYYAKIVREKASLRGLIHAGTRITQLGYESEDDVPAALDESEQIVYEVGNRDSRGSFSAVSSLLLDTFHELEKRHSQRGDRTGVTSGFSDIDDYTAGFQKGNLIILAARPAMGKTSLALNMALFGAREEAAPVAVFSLEMTKQELVERLISSDAGIDAGKLAPRFDRGQGVGADRKLDRPAQRVAALPRRLGFGHRQRNSQPLTPAQIDARPGDRVHRLPATRAPVGDGPQRQPQRRTLRDLPHAQSDGERSRDPDRRARAVKPRRRNAPRQTPYALGPS